MAVADRGERRSQHHALDARVARGAQHAQRALARGHDQLVFVLRDALGKGGRHVQHVLAAGDGRRPARVGFEIGGDERQAIARLGAALLEHRAHVGLALQAAHGRAHLMARGQ